MPISPLAFRALTLAAVSFLGFDAAALMGLGIWSGRRAVLVAGMVLLISSGLVLLLWRRHLRRLEDIKEARRDLRDEAEDLRRLLRG